MPAPAPSFSGTLCIINLLEVCENEFASNFTKEDTEEATRAGAYEQNTQENKVTKTSSEQDMPKIEAKPMPRPKKKKEEKDKEEEEKEKEEEKEEEEEKEKDLVRFPLSWFSPATAPGACHPFYYATGA